MIRRPFLFGVDMTEIITERLVLRPLRDDDAQALANAANNYEVVREGIVDTLLLKGVNHVYTVLTRERWLSL